MKKQILFLTMIALIPSMIDSADRDSDYAEPSAPLNRPVSTKKKSWWNKLSPQARAGIIAGGAVAGTALAAGGALAGYHYLSKESQTPTVRPETAAPGSSSGSSFWNLPSQGQSYPELTSGVGISGEVADPGLGQSGW